MKKSQRQKKNIKSEREKDNVDWSLKHRKGGRKKKKAERNEQKSI